MREDILVTGGSDGSVRVWSLADYQAIHRLAAHDNSVTSLQFDNTRIVSGGSDGRVKVWDLKKGSLVRELSQPAEAVWRVVFEEEKAVIMAQRGGRTIMEVSLVMQSVLRITLVTDPCNRCGPFRRPKKSSKITVPQAQLACLITPSSTLEGRTRRLSLQQPRHRCFKRTGTTSPWLTLLRQYNWRDDTCL